MYELTLNINTKIDLFKILSPEMKQQNKFRSEVIYKKTSKGMEIKINSPDLNSLRASINSHLLWLKTVESVENL